MYGRRLPSGKMVFPKEYKNIIRKYNDFLNEGGALASYYSTTSKYEIAREKMIEYLRDKWHKGAKNMVAQTRLASSYGLLQMLYSTAVETEEMSYPSLNPDISPEDFNVTDTNMTYSVKYMKNLLQNELTSAVEYQGNWPGGFEYCFTNDVWANWNTDPTYPVIVYSYTQKFLPQSK